ncbi:MAG: hypothetical protein QM813_17035 [Verrucomicrobiota bacterium]
MSGYLDVADLMDELAQRQAAVQNLGSADDCKEAAKLLRQAEDAQRVLDRLYAFADVNRSNVGQAGSLRMPGTNLVALKVIEEISQHLAAP